MKKKFYAFLTLIILITSNVKSQSVPELLHYKFDGTGSTVPNLASTPPVGATTANLMGGVTQGSTGQCGGAIIGTGNAASTDYLNTNWNTNLGSGSWTIAFWSSGISINTTLYYIFGDNTANSFRCFTNGVAGNNNWILRGGGLADVLLTGGALMTPTVNTFVYDNIANEVRGYLNGNLVVTVPQTAPSIVGTSPFKVMGYGTNVGAPAGGLMDEFRLYNRALSAAEVLALNSAPSLGTDVVSACDSYTWINGITYTANNNTDQDTIFGGSSSGCDSIVILNLTLNNSSNGIDVISSCNSYTWIDNVTYTVSNNTATHILTGANSVGCDSVVMLDLTILPAINISITNASLTLTSNETGASYQWLDCDNNNAIILGETSQSFTATANGNYAVEIKVGNCVDTSACENIIINSINELSDLGISIYPNPINDFFTIRFDNEIKSINYSISTIEGRLVKYANDVIGNNLIVDLSNESKGIYFLTINQGETTNYYKIIKQ